MQESGAKRPAKLLRRNSTEENDRADTLSSACQVGDADGDVPAHPSKTTELAQTPESSQETAIFIDDAFSHRLSVFGTTVRHTRAGRRRVQSPAVLVVKALCYCKGVTKRFGAKRSAIAIADALLPRELKW